MAYFKLDKTKKIYIYGAASIGKILYENLRINGFCVQGFIDKRACEIPKFMSKKVYQLEELKYIDKESIIIVGVKNVFEHFSIAKILVEQGFYNIIFKPQNVLDNCANEDEIKISEAYNELLEKGTISNINLAKTYLCKKEFNKDYALKKIYEDNQVLAWIPISFLFTNNYDLDKNKWGNVNLYAFFTHDEFFRYLMGNDNVNPNYYLNEYCTYTALMQNDIKITDLWKENVIRNRSMIFDQMSVNLETDIEFFERNSATVSWNNEKKYFNLTSGKHRTMFFVAKGYKNIPVRMSKEDYESYLNLQKLNTVGEIIANNKVELYEYIFHPYFLKNTSKGIEYINNCIHQITNYLSKKSFEITGAVNFDIFEIEDLMDNWHCIGRHLRRCGSKLQRKNQSSLVTAIDELEQVEVKNRCSDSVNVYLVDNKKDIKDVTSAIFFYDSQENIDDAILLTKGVIDGVFHFLFVVDRWIDDIR